MIKLNKVLIIAEAGINHNGSLKKAKKLVDIAKKARADYVKFQIFKPENIVVNDAKLANYQKKNSKNKNQLELLNKNKLKFSEFKELYKYAKYKKIKFLATAFDEDSLKFLLTFNNIDFIKIPSGEINNLPLLKLIKNTNKKILLSTGASTENDIAKALKVLNKNKVIILHCNSAYPTPIEDLNLNSISYLKKKFKCTVGLSDHSDDIYSPIISLALGAKVIEKHFTINNKLNGPDHKSSLNPNKLFKMIKLIRLYEKSLGDYSKKISLSELMNLKVIRKSIVAKKIIFKGEKFSKANLTCKRPGDGISPMNWNKIIGKKAKKNYKINEKI